MITPLVRAAEEDKDKWWINEHGEKLGAESTVDNGS